MQTTALCSTWGYYLMLQTAASTKFHQIGENGMTNI
jgi:hypothetical protein